MTYIFINSKIKSHIKTINNWADSIAFACLLLVFLTLGISRVLFLLFTVLALTAWIFSGNYREKFRLLSKNPPAILIILLVFYIFARASFSAGSDSDINYSLNVTWKLALIPVIVTTIRDRISIDRCWQAFSAGMVVLLMHVYTSLFYHLPWLNDSSSASAVFYNPLPQSIALVIFSLYCIKVISNKDSNTFEKTIYTFIFLAAAYAVLQISQQRLGYLTFFIGIAVVFWSILKKQKRWIATVLFILASTLIVTSSPKIKSRITQAYQDVASYEFKPNYTSVGSRLHMWYSAWQSIKEKPILGFGPGSYSTIAKKSFDNDIMCSIGCVHSHNQYIYTWLENGLIGLLLYVGALFSALKGHLKNPSIQPIAVSVIAIFIISSFVETLLWYRAWVYLFVPFLGLLSVYGPLRQSTTNIKYHK